MGERKESAVVNVDLIAVPLERAIEPGDDLGALLAAALEKKDIDVQAEDVLVVCQKVVSKAEGRIVRLSAVEPSERARRFAREFGKDPAVVELALREAREIVRMERGHLITATGPGWVCANSGVDRSNQNAEGYATLLPEDADASARRLRRRLESCLDVAPAVLVSDTFGRPWRLGQIDVAIGAAGLEVLDDLSGHADWSGRVLEHTCAAVADQLAAAAGLLMRKDAGTPAVLVRGFPYKAGDGRAADLVRPREDDLFR